VRGIATDVEHEDHAVIEATEPELAPVVREAAVVRLVPAAHRDRVDHLAVLVGAARVHAHRDELVGAVAEALHAERPDVEVILLPRHLRQIGRLAGLVRRGGGDAGQRRDAEGAENPPMRHRKSPFARRSILPPTAGRRTGVPAPVSRSA
jgi:hypothetical protein